MALHWSPLLSFCAGLLVFDSLYPHILFRIDCPTILPSYHFIDDSP